MIPHSDQDLTAPVVGFTPKLSEANVNFNSVATTTIVNVTESGELILIGWQTSSAVSGSPIVKLEITIDGGTKLSLSVHASSGGWDANGILPFNNGAAGNDGAATGDGIALPLRIRYTTSLLVEVDVTSTGTGQAQCSVIRGTEI